MYFCPKIIYPLMKVFKFGGASVKDARGVKNLASIVQQYNGELIVVVSAMGKVTNQLEKLCQAYFQKNSVANDLKDLKNYHWGIISELFDAYSPVHDQVNSIFVVLEELLQMESSLCYDYEYDRIICFGELLSTTIVAAYLNQVGIANQWVDARRVLKTDQNYRDANIDWELSKELCRQTFTFQNTCCYITQGFIAGTRTNQTTTLGREGSDYTAALLASLLGGDDVTIWKDVPGVSGIS